MPAARRMRNTFQFDSPWIAFEGAAKSHLFGEMTTLTTIASAGRRRTAIGALLRFGMRCPLRLPQAWLFI